MKRGVLQDIRDLLRYYGALGISSCPDSPELQDFLKTSPVACSAATVAGKGRAGATHIPPGAAGLPGAQRNMSVETVAELSTQLEQCALCELEQKREAVLAERNCSATKVDVVFVGDWLHSGPGSTLKHIFGREEDLMFSKMLTAIHLKEEDVFVTNVIKCCVFGEFQVRAEHVAACSPYLLEQIALLSPEIVCAMGPVAVRALCGSGLSLSKMRGRLHSCSLGGQKHVPLLATYHPNFLLKNQEMKKATWVDLQFLEKKLQELKRGRR